MKKENKVYFLGAMVGLFLIPWMLLFMNILFPERVLLTTIMYSIFGLIGIIIIKREIK